MKAQKVVVCKKENVNEGQDTLKAFVLKIKVEFKDSGLCRGLDFEKRLDIFCAAIFIY